MAIVVRYYDAERGEFTKLFSATQPLFLPSSPCVLSSMCQVKCSLQLFENTLDLRSGAVLGTEQSSRKIAIRSLGFIARSLGESQTDGTALGMEPEQ